MIVYVILIVLILMILSWTLVPNRVLRVLLGSMLTIALTCMVTLLTMTFKDHYGMRQISVSETKPIYSATGKKLPMGVMVVSKIGKDDKKHKIMIYQDSVSSKAKAHFVPNQNRITESIKWESYYSQEDIEKATLTTETTRWKWKSEKYKYWFDVGQEDELVKRVSKIKIPKDTWIVLSPKQMEKMEMILKGKVDSASSGKIEQQVSMSKREQAIMMVKMMNEELNE